MPLVDKPQLLILLPQDRMREELHRMLVARVPDVVARAAATAAEAMAFAADIDAIATFGSTLTPPLLAAARRLRWVHSLGTGVDSIADNPDLGADVLVTATRGIQGPAIAEMAFCMMLALSRDLPRNLKNQTACRWERWPAALLYGKKIGILGVGAIAQDLAARCKAFGMDVTGISRTPRFAPGFDRMVGHEAMHVALGELDYVVLTIPYSLESDRIVNAKFLSCMKPSAFLVNLARGGVVDEEALVRALRRRQIAGAGLDVFSAEPLPPASPLWKLDNVIITAHQGGMSDTYVADAFPVLERNLRAFGAGTSGAMENLVAR